MSRIQPPLYTKLLILLTFVILSGQSGCVSIGKNQHMQVLGVDDINGINKGLQDSKPTVDIVFVRDVNTPMTLEAFLSELESARKIFAEHGVQLRLMQALRVKFPKSWVGLVPYTWNRSYLPKAEQETNFYRQFEVRDNRLPKVTQKVFAEIVPNTAQARNTIYVATLKDLVIEWPEKDSQGKWLTKSSTTSAISFPGYLTMGLNDTHYRGIISMEKAGLDQKTLAHELGHKLANVTHEGLDKCPKTGGGDSIPGLMGYGPSKKLHSGKKGRWHGERLRRSPFVYRIIKKQKVWNPDYQAGGVYADPIYGKYIMDPICK